SGARIQGHRVRSRPPIRAEVSGGFPCHARVSEANPVLQGRPAVREGSGVEVDGGIATGVIRNKQVVTANRPCIGPSAVSHFKPVSIVGACGGTRIGTRRLAGNLIRVFLTSIDSDRSVVSHRGWAGIGPTIITANHIVWLRFGDGY